MQKIESQMTQICELEEKMRQKETEREEAANDAKRVQKSIEDLIQMHKSEKEKLETRYQLCKKQLD